MIKVLKLMLLLSIILSCCCVLLFGFDEWKELDEFFFDVKEMEESQMEIIVSWLFVSVIDSFFCMLWEENFFFLGSDLNKYFKIWNRLLFDVLELFNRSNVYEGEKRGMSKRRMWLGY